MLVAALEKREANISQLDLITSKLEAAKIYLIFLKNCEIYLCFFQFSSVFIAQELILRSSENGIYNI